MGLEWNPGYPDVVGLQRQDVGYGANPATSQNSWQALQFVAKHSGATDWMELFGSGTTSQLGAEHFSQERPMVLDLFQGDDVSYPVFLDTFIPNAITGSSGMVNENLTPANVNRIQAVDNLFLASAAINHYVRVQFPTSTFPLDRRVLGIRLFIRGNATTLIARVDATGNAPWQKTRSLGSGGSYQNWLPLWSDVLTDSASTPDWSFWTPQRVRDFRSGGPCHLFVRCKSSPGKWRLDTVRMEVFWTPETRVGVGVNPPSGSFAWSSFEMRTPAATGTPSLTAGQTYTAVLREPWNDSEFSVGTATLSWRDLNGSPLVTGWDTRPLKVSSLAVTGSTFQLASMPRPVDVFPVPIKASTLCFQCVTGAPSIAGGVVVETAMPYVLSRGARVRNAQTPLKASDPAIPARTLEQTITVTGSGTAVTYGQTSAVVGWNTSRPPALTATISTEVWTATGAPEVRVFSPVARTFFDISRAPVNTDFPVGEGNLEYRLVRFRHPESRVLPAGQYQIRVTAADLVGDTTWYVDADISNAHVVDQTFGRSTDEATGVWQSGAVEHPLSGSDSAGSWSSDLPVTLMTVPPPVTGFAAAVGVTTAHHAEVCAGESCANPGCADAASPFTELTWDITSDTLSDRYEVQRSDVIDDVFRTVALVRDRSSTRWVDHEGRIGVQSFYRVRSVRSDGVTGDWSAIVSSTPPAGQIALTFTSNAATGLAVVYPEIYDRKVITREFEFQEYGTVSLQPIYSRERQAAFHSLERLGTRFDRTILLNALCTVALPTLQIFTPLRLLTWAPVPYVCVRDGEGNRWFANVQVPTGRNERPAEFWFADIIVTEVAASPSVADTDVPQVTVETMGDLVL